MNKPERFSTSNKKFNRHISVYTLKVLFLINMLIGTLLN